MTGDIPLRPLGATGAMVSALGLGGYHIGHMTSERVFIHLAMLAHDFEAPDGGAATRVREQAADGRFELYKTTAQNDGTVGRKEHGYPDDEELSA